MSAVEVHGLEFNIIYVKESLTGIEKKKINNVQKMKFSIKDFFSKCDHIHRKLWIWSHLLKKSLMKNFTFCTVKWEDDFGDGFSFYSKLTGPIEITKCWSKFLKFLCSINILSSILRSKLAFSL